MKAFLDWLGPRTVLILAILAAVGVSLSWTLDVFAGLKPIGTLPLIYDLCLAYLTGWVFHVLVVVWPERRRSQSLVSTLRGNLMMIANNGADLLRDLEFLGRCPEKTITRGHVLRVCTANNDNDATRRLLTERLSVARDAYRRAAPFLASLPHDVAMAIQVVDQQFLNLALDVPDRLDLARHTDPTFVSTQPHAARVPTVVWTPTNTSPTPSRLSMRGWHDLVLEYCLSTEVVRTVLTPLLHGKPEQAEAVEFWANHKMNEVGFPWSDYPAEASSEAWTGATPSPPSIVLGHS